jgi:hypothetical protein
MSVTTSKRIPLTDKEATWLEANIKIIPIYSCIAESVYKCIVLNSEGITYLSNRLSKPCRFLNGNEKHTYDKAMRSQIWHKLNKLRK